MVDLAQNLNDGGSLAIQIAAVAAGGIAGYAVGRITRSAFEDATNWFDGAVDKATGLFDLDLDFGDSLDFGPNGFTNLGGVLG